MIQVEHLHFHYPSTSSALFHSLSFEVKQGERVAITGPSGVGKTTLIKILAGLLPCRDGLVVCAGTALHLARDNEASEYRNAHVGVVFQDYNLLGDLTVDENLRLRLAIAGQTFNESFAKKINGLLTKVGMEGFRNVRVRELSGGQQQRVAAVRALITSPEVLLADEPTGNLDDETAGLVTNLLLEEHPRRVVVVATHDQRVIERFSREVSMENLEGGV